MLQTPGSLKNRDVSLTAFFPPRTRCVWGDNWRVPWHAASERAPHSAAHSHTKLDSLSACTSASMVEQWAGREGLRVCLYGHACVCVWMCPCAFVWDVRLSEKEEGDRLIIPFLVQHNSFLLGLREHSGVMRDEPKTARLCEYCSEEGLYVYFFFSSPSFSTLLPSLFSPFPCLDILASVE